MNALRDDASGGGVRFSMLAINKSNGISVNDLSVTGSGGFEDASEGIHRCIWSWFGLNLQV